MRVHLAIISKEATIPFDHQHLLVGTIHKWLERNTEHGGLSLYSFSRLTGGKASGNGLKMEHRTSLFFSSHYPDLLKRLITGIQYDPVLFNGLFVDEIIIKEDPDLTNREVYHVASPIFIKRREGTNIEHVLYKDPRSSIYLTETLRTKLKAVGNKDDSLDISFINNYPNASTKMVTYRGIDNRANWCPVIIKGKPETKLFAWNVGLGNSTGIGFGALI